MAESHYVGTVAPTTPLYLQIPPGYEALPPHLKDYGSTKQFWDYKGLTLDLPKIGINMVVPPLVFSYVISMLSFKAHYRFPAFVYLFAAVGILPALFAYQMLKQAIRRGTNTRFPQLSVVLLLAAFCSAFVFGEVNYWYYNHPFFFLEGLKTYSNIDPTGMSGQRLMDAGKVYFSEGTRLGTDLAMSFTSTWDVYCVAPITTAEGLPSQGSMLAKYDMWAVGVNCCKSGVPSFYCDDGNPHTRAGLRQVGDEQRVFFRLAVEQAEAAYNIEAPHPIFFYWVPDPIQKERVFFEAGFTFWLLANMAHAVLNFFGVLAFLLMFHRPPNIDGLPGH